MTVTFCILAAMLMLISIVLCSREMSGISRIQLSWGLHAFSILLILVALSSRGIWYSASTYLGDLWTIVDALQKTDQGLRSSVDYFSPIGPAMQWILSLTLLVQAPAASSIVLANALVASAAMFLSIVLLRERASAWTIAIVGLIAVSTALSPRDIDSLIVAKQSDFLAPYNRWGWALILPVAMRAATSSSRADLLGSFFTGVVISVLILLKITYGAAALGLYAFAIAIQPSRWRDGATVAAVLAAILVNADLLTGGQLRAYFADLVQAARMPSNGVRIDKFLMELPAFTLFAVGALVIGATRGIGNDPFTRLVANWRPLLLAAATGGAGLFVLMQNHYLSEPTLLWLMPLIMAESTGLFSPQPGRPAELWGVGAELRILILLVTLALPTMDAGFILAQKAQLLRKSADPALAGTHLHDLVVDTSHLPGPDGLCADSTCVDYRRMVGGRNLLRQACVTDASNSVLALNFSNPFPALTGALSPQGAPIWLHADRSFSSTVHVPPDVLLHAVGCILEAKDESNSRALISIYGESIRSKFTVKAQDGDWLIWARN